MWVEFNCVHCDSDFETVIPADAHGNEEIVCEKCGYATTLSEMYPDAYCVRCEAPIDSKTRVEGYDINGAICLRCKKIDDDWVSGLEKEMREDAQRVRNEKLLKEI